MLVSNDIFYFLSITFGSAFFSYFLVPLIKKVSFFRKIKDIPDKRKTHKYPIPRIGGIAIFFSFSIFIFLIYNSGFFLSQINQNLFWSIYLITSFSFLLGLFDDINSVSPFLRLLSQIIVVIIFVNSSGVSTALNILQKNESLINIPFFCIFILFFLWVSGVTNSINWLDGLDGLAISSVVTITSAILCISIFNQNYLQTLILVPLLGASMGFIPHNIMPAKVYMGDGGSYLLGTALSVVSLLGIIDLNLNEVNLIKIFIPLTLLIIPILDMTYVILKRLSLKKSPFFPDMNHLHHRLMRNGLNKKNALLTANLMIIFTSFIAIIINGTNLLILLSFFAFNLILFITYQRSNTNIEKREIKNSNNHTNF